MCVFPILALIPFGVKTKAEVFDDTLINKMKNISVEHGLWAKFVCDALEQNKNSPKTTDIAKRLISSQNTKKSGNACQAMTKRIQKTYVPITSPFIETSLVTKKYPDEQAILREFFVVTPLWQASPLMSTRMMTMMMTCLKFNLSAHLMPEIRTLR
jgi:hypothetical protein